MSPDPTPARKAPDGEAEWRLPRGPHRLPRQVVDDHQRQRLLTAAAVVLAERGYAEMSVEHVIRQAGVSRATFYQHFENKRECVLVAHEEAFDRLTGDLVRACAAQAEWVAKVKAGVATAVAFAVQTPEEAHLLILDTVAPDPALATRVLASNDFLVGLLRNGREHCLQAAVLPELTERALIGATTSLIGTRLLAGQVDRLPAIESQIVQLLLMPYLGVEEARLAAL